MEPQIILSYSLVLLSVLSIWLPVKLFNKLPLWLFFTILSFLLAILFERASYVSLIYTATLGLTSYYYYQKKSWILFFLVLLLSIPLLLHFPELGFNNYCYLNEIVVSSGAVAYSQYFNLDKTLVGIFIIAFSFKEAKIHLSTIFKYLSISLFIMALVFFSLATALGYAVFEPKLPYFTPIWILVNLFSTCLAEEAVFRKLIQQKIYDSIPGKYAFAISLSIASLAFGLAHFQGGMVYVLLSSLAGMFYGFIYYKTQRIESAMLLHFLFNLTHLLLFTYPALKS